MTLRSIDSVMSQKGLPYSPALITPPPPADPAPGALQQLLVDGSDLKMTGPIADLILRDAEYAGQRPVHEKFVSKLALEIHEQQFISGVQIAFGYLDGKLYLINGRHRTRAVAQTRIPQVFAIRIHQCEDAARLAWYYRHYDRLQRTRTRSQIIESTGLVDETPGGLTKLGAEILHMAMPILMTGFKRMGNAARPIEVGIDDKIIEAAKPWLPAARAYQMCLDCGTRKETLRFRTAGIGSVALATLRFQPKEAAKFWVGSIEDEALRRGDPRRALVARLREYHSETAYDLSYIAATGWNAWHEGRDLSIVKMLVDAPIRVGGTPFGRRG
jgi:hypothetical protein